jgi:hypothetical protein
VKLRDMDALPGWVHVKILDHVLTAVKFRVHTNGEYRKWAWNFQ